MLTSFRKSAGSWFTKIFLFILVVSFGIWGVADFVNSAKEAPLAKVAGKTISAQEYNANYRRELFRLQQQYGPDYTSAKAREMGLDREVLRQMLVAIMYDREAAQLSLTASDETIATSIRENASFRDSLGQFDKNIFRRVLNDNGFAEKEYLHRARMDLTRQQLIAAVGSGVVVPQKIAAAFYMMREEQRIADILYIPQSAVGKISGPDNAALESFYKANPALFTAPEIRMVSYLTLRPEDLAKTIVPDEKELREQYDARLAEFTVSSMRNIQQFVLPDEAAAKAAHDKIKNGNDFEKVAKQTSGMSPKDLELREVTREMLPAGIADAVFALKEREISQPLKSPLGWHLVRITAARQERVSPFEEVRNRIAAELALSKATELVIEYSTRLEDARAGGASLEEAAREFNLKLQVIAGVDRQGKALDGKPAANLVDDPKFLADIFETEEGSESDLRENKEGGYYVLRVDSVTPAAVRPLAEVRSETTAAWRAQATGEKLLKLADDSLKAAEDGKSLTEIASPLGLKITQGPPIQRSYTSDQINAALTAKLFTGKPGSNFGEPAPAGGYTIARLREIKTPSVNDKTDAVARLGRDLAKIYADDVLAQYQSVLERRYDVEVNQSRLASLFDEQ